MNFGQEENTEHRWRFDQVVCKIQDLPGIHASFHRYGSRALVREALLRELGQEDASLGFTHCLLIVADSPKALKEYLHGPVQTQELSPTMGPFFQGVFVLDTDLAVSMCPRGKEDPVLMITALRFPPHVAVGSPAYLAMQAAVGRFSEVPGVSASLRHMGHNGLSKDQFYAKIEWPDRTFGMTHCLTVAADSPARLRELLDSDAHVAWLEAHVPELARDEHEPVLTMVVPQQCEVAC